MDRYVSVLLSVLGGGTCGSVLLQHTYHMHSNGLLVMSSCKGEKGDSGRKGLCRETFTRYGVILTQKPREAILQVIVGSCHQEKHLFETRSLGGLKV
jgi:hypothetical protein